MKLVIDGNAGAGTISMGGFDYHTGDRATGEARDLRAGRCIGACLEYAALDDQPPDDLCSSATARFPRTGESTIPMGAAARASGPATISRPLRRSSSVLQPGRACHTVGRGPRRAAARRQQIGYYSAGDGRGDEQQPGRQQRQPAGADRCSSTTWHCTARTSALQRTFGEKSSGHTAARSMACDSPHPPRQRSPDFFRAVDSPGPARAGPFYFARDFARANARKCRGTKITSYTIQAKIVVDFRGESPSASAIRAVATLVRSLTMATNALERQEATARTDFRSSSTTAWPKSACSRRMRARS